MSAKLIHQFTQSHIRAIGYGFCFMCLYVFPLSLALFFKIVDFSKMPINGTVKQRNWQTYRDMSLFGSNEKASDFLRLTAETKIPPPH